MVVCAGFDKQLHIFSPPTKDMRHVTAGQSVIRAIYHDGSNLPFLILGNDDGRLIAVDEQNGTSWELAFVSDSVYSISGMSATNRFFVAQRSGEITQWQLSNLVAIRREMGRAENLRLIHRHDGSAFATKYNGTTNECISVGSDGMIRTTNLTTGENTITKLSEGTLFSLAVNDKKNLFAVGDSQGKICFWGENSNRRELEGHSDNVRTLRLSPQGRWLISGSKDRTVRIWEVRSARVWILWRTKDYVYDIALSPDSSEVAVVDGNGDLSVLNLRKAIDEFTSEDIEKLIDSLLV